MPCKLKNRLSKKTRKLSKSKRSRRLQKKSFSGGKPLNITTANTTTPIISHLSKVNSTVFHPKSIDQIKWGVSADRLAAIREKYQNTYLMAVGCANGSIKLYSIKSYSMKDDGTDSTLITELITELFHGVDAAVAEVKCLVFNLNLPVLVSGGSDGIVKLWQFKLGVDNNIELDRIRGNKADGSYTIDTKNPIEFDKSSEQFGMKTIDKVEDNRIYLKESPNDYSFKNGDAIMFMDKKYESDSKSFIPEEINTTIIYYVTGFDPEANSFRITNYIDNNERYDDIIITNTPIQFYCRKKIYATGMTSINSISFYNYRSSDDNNPVFMYHHMAISGNTRSVLLLTLRFRFETSFPEICMINATMLKHPIKYRTDTTDINVHFCNVGQYMVTTCNYNENSGSIILWKMDNLNITWNQTSSRYTNDRGIPFDKFRLLPLNGTILLEQYTEYEISSVISHPGSQYLVIGCYDGSVRIFNYTEKLLNEKSLEEKSLEELYILRPKSMVGIQRITFHTTQTRLEDGIDNYYKPELILASAGDNKAIHLWKVENQTYDNLKKPELLLTSTLDSVINTISFLPSEKSNIMIIGTTNYTKFLNYEYTSPVPILSLAGSLNLVKGAFQLPAKAVGAVTGWWQGNSKSTTRSLADEVERVRQDASAQEKLNQEAQDRLNIANAAAEKVNLQNAQRKAADELKILNSFIPNINSEIGQITTQSTELSTETQLKLGRPILNCIADPEAQQNIYCKKHVKLLLTAVMLGLKGFYEVGIPIIPDDLNSIVIFNPKHNSHTIESVHKRQPVDNFDILNQDIRFRYNPALTRSSPRPYDDPDKAYLQKFPIHTYTSTENNKANGFGGYSLFSINFHALYLDGFDVANRIERYYRWLYNANYTYKPLYISLNDHEFYDPDNYFTQRNPFNDIMKTYFTPITFDPYKFYDVNHTNEGKAYMGDYINDTYHGTGHYYTCFAYGSKVKILKPQSGVKLIIPTPRGYAYPYSDLWSKPRTSNIGTIDPSPMDTDIVIGNYGTIVGYTNPLKTHGGQHIVVKMDRQPISSDKPDKTSSVKPNTTIQVIKPDRIIIFDENSIELLTQYSFHGHFDNDLRHGYGEINVHSLEGVETPITFKGNFVDDKRNGYGIIQYSAPNGDIYTFEGFFVDDKRDGYGKITNVSTDRSIYAKFDKGKFVPDSYHNHKLRHIPSNDTDIGEIRKYIEDEKYGLNLW
jgi:WD40 repeat protein